MSYDLSFHPRPGADVPSVAALDAYFADRDHYRSGDGTAAYANEDTDVGFRLAYDATQRGYGDVGPIGLSAATSGNQTRALELVGEVEALVAAFDLLVDDPTMNGMGRGELDRDALLRGCLFASRFGLCADVAMGSLVPKDAPLFDDARFEEHWRWNLGRAALQRAATDAVFVPKVTYLVHRGEVLSSVAWVGTGPILLPDVDAIVTLDANGSGADLKVVRTVEFAAPLDDAPLVERPRWHRVVQPTAALTAAIARAKGCVPRPTQVANSSVLGRVYAEQVEAQFFEWSGGQRIAFGRSTAGRATVREAVTAPAKKSAKKSAKTSRS